MEVWLGRLPKDARSAASPARIHAPAALMVTQMEVEAPDS